VLELVEGGDLLDYILGRGGLSNFSSCLLFYKALTLIVLRSGKGHPSHNVSNMRRSICKTTQPRDRRNLILIYLCSIFMAWASLIVT